MGAVGQRLSAIWFVINLSPLYLFETICFAEVVGEVVYNGFFEFIDQEFPRKILVNHNAYLTNGFRLGESAHKRFVG